MEVEVEEWTTTLVVMTPLFYHAKAAIEAVLLYYGKVAHDE